MAAFDQLVGPDQVHRGWIYVVKADQRMLCHRILKLLWSDVVGSSLQLLPLSGASFDKQGEHGCSDHPRPVPAHSVEEVAVPLCSGQQLDAFECCALEAAAFHHFDE